MNAAVRRQLDAEVGKIPRGIEARRLWIAEQADELCIPACFTPRWQAAYGRRT